MYLLVQFQSVQSSVEETINNKPPILGVQQTIIFSIDYYVTYFCN